MRLSCGALGVRVCTLDKQNVIVWPSRNVDIVMSGEPDADCELIEEAFFRNGRSFCLLRFRLFRDRFVVFLEADKPIAA